MPKPTNNELEKSIQELISYRERLASEVKSIAQKLQMPKKQVELSLKQNSELKKIDQVIFKLTKQLKTQKDS